MRPLDTLLTALGGITTNKLRAALTTLGIVMGVASVMTMLALGNGARAAVEANFRFLGSDTVHISVKREWEQGELVPVGRILSIADGLQMPGAVEQVVRVDLSLGGAAKVRRGRAVLDMAATGVTADGLHGLMRRNQVQPAGRQPADGPAGAPLTPAAFLGEGRFFTPAEVLAGADVCVLGHKTALDLFEGDSALDEVIWVSRRRCIVIGVLAELEVIDPTMRNRMRPNESLYLPVSTVARYLYEDEPSVLIAARVADEGRMVEARAQIAAYLRERHGIERAPDGTHADDFEMTTRRDVLGAQQDAARTFSLLLAAMAVVSLIVGGIGIMNVMLVSVTERTREIGVRLAVGARRREIRLQFLLEAVLISAFGGVLGIAVGILAIPLAATLNQGIALLAPQSIPLGLGISLVVGITFGLYPAWRASRLDPIEALRYE